MTTAIIWNQLQKFNLKFIGIRRENVKEHAVEKARLAVIYQMKKFRKN